MCSNESGLILSCPLCCQTNFPNVDSLKLSLLKVTSRPLKCPICDEIVLGLDKLTIHLFAHSLLPDEHQQQQQQQQQQQHREMPTREDLKIVRKSSNRGKKKDKNKVQPPPPPPLSPPAPEKCNQCGLQFQDKTLHELHLKIVHDIPGPSREAEPKFQCHLCPKTYKMKGSLRLHLRMAHYGFQIKFDSSEQNGGEAPPQPPANDAEQKSDNVCDICGKSFTTKYFLKKHKRLHTGETPYACNLCGKTFTFQQSYHKHLLYHSDEKPHVCTVCSRAFKELSTLHNHERIHSGEKPFKCEVCNKCFRQRVSYLVHRRIHTGVMPYKCTACDKSFRYKVSQRTHKCTVQPPGTVVRQTGDLLQKLLHSAAIFSNGSEEDPISKSLDALVNESCDKMGIENGFGDSAGINMEQNIPSPSEGFRQLSIMPSSPENSMEFKMEAATPVNGETLQQLLFLDRSNNC